VLERHRDIAVASRAVRSRIHESAAPLINGKEGRVVLLSQAEADAEEIADRDLDTRLGFAVPVGTQDVVLEMMRFAAGDVVAELCDAPGPVNIGQDEGLAWFEPAPIIVAPGRISRSDPVGLELVEGGQVVQSEILGLARPSGAEKKEHPDS